MKPRPKFHGAHAVPRFHGDGTVSFLSVARGRWSRWRADRIPWIEWSTWPLADRRRLGTRLRRRKP